MLPILALLVLACPLSTPQADTLSEKKERQVEQLEAALAANKPTDIVRTLRSAAKIDHPRVREAIAISLNSKNVGIQSASLEALRFQPNAEALASLHKMFTRKKVLLENPPLVAQLLRATGHRADMSSLAPLSAGGFRQDSDDVLRARIFAIGNLQGRDAINALLVGMNSTPDRQRLLHMDEFRLALVKLTGADWGMDYEAWTDWWRENQGDVTLPKPDAPLPRYIERDWEAYWGSTSVLPLAAPKKPEPAPAAKKQPAARNPKAGAGGAAKGRPVEANAKGPAKTPAAGPGAKKPGAKAPYRRPGKEGTPPKGQKAQSDRSQDAAGKAPASGPANESETPGAKDASGTPATPRDDVDLPAESPERTRSIRAPKWSVDDPF
jgi:hypothetical protein